MAEVEGPATSDLAEDEARSSPEMSPWQVVVTGVLGVASAGAGAVAVFETKNDVGSAALLTLGLYFLIAMILRRFPKLKFGDTEIDPATRRIAQQANRRSLLAEEDAKDAKEGLKRAASRSEFTAPDERGLSAPLDGRITELAAEYNEVRWTMPSGRARTRRMTDIVEEMIAVFRVKGAPDVGALLASEDRGLRLSGVAAVYAKPRSDVIPALVRIGVTPDKPFNEYWALAALRKAIDGHCEDLTVESRNELRVRLHDLHPGTDRAEEIRRVLEMCP